MTMQSNRRLRALLIAEAANPEWVSVPLVGWSHARALAQQVDALLVTQVRNREAILRAGLREGEDGDFVAIDTEAVARPVGKAASLLRGGAGKGWTLVTAAQSLSYYEFERKVVQRFGDRLRRGEFDIVHRITPLSPTTPSFCLPRCCRRAGVPFVVGPLNGGVPWPKAYDAVRRAEREWLSYIRGVYKLMPGYRTTRRLASAIIVGSRDTRDQLDPRYLDKTYYVPENAIDPARFTQVRQRTAGRPLRIVFVGRLVPYKGADVLLEAAAPAIRGGQITVDIVGDGPQRGDLEAMIQRLGLGQGATLRGSIPHEQVQAALAESDVFAFPSIREFGGAVVLEAMAVGLLPVVVAYGGPAELISPATGIGIEMCPRAGLVERFRAALERLADQPAMVDTMGAAARQRVLRHFTWPAKAASVVEIYRWAMDPTRPRPALPLPIPD